MVIPRNKKRWGGCGRASRNDSASSCPPPERQNARIAKLAKIKSRLAKVPRDSWRRSARGHDTWLAPDALRPIVPADRTARAPQGFQEIDGRSDRVVLVYPSLKINYNDGRNILAFADRLAGAQLPRGR